MMSDEQFLLINPIFKREDMQDSFDEVSTAIIQVLALIPKHSTLISSEVSQTLLRNLIQVRARPVFSL